MLTQNSPKFDTNIQLTKTQYSFFIFMLANPRQVNAYRRYLLEFMNFKDEPPDPYTTATQFSQEQLLRITDKDVYEWLVFKEYNTCDPTSEDNPTNCRCNTLQYAKKALSYFMPNRNTQWCVALNTGNTTKSTKVNNLLKGVKKRSKKGRQGISSPTPI